MLTGFCRDAMSAALLLLVVGLVGWLNGRRSASGEIVSVRVGCKEDAVLGSGHQG